MRYATTCQQRHFLYHQCPTNVPRIRNVYWWHSHSKNYIDSMHPCMTLTSNVVLHLQGELETPPLERQPVVKMDESRYHPEVPCICMWCRTLHPLPHLCLVSPEHAGGKGWRSCMLLSRVVHAQFRPAAGRSRLAQQGHMFASVKRHGSPPCTYA